jgi:6-phosphogluconolactonase (cycloisomerase 2 family)
VEAATLQRIFTELNSEAVNDLPAARSKRTEFKFVGCFLKCWKYLGALAILVGLSSCNFDKYSVGGTVTGLLGTGLEIADNGGSGLTFTANGAFVFKDEVSNDGAYAVTVVTQPTNPSQTCTVRNGSGTIDKANITNVLVTCTQAGSYAYVANQTANTISAYAIDDTTGVLTGLSGSPFVDSGTAPWALAVDRNYNFLYVVNNSSDTVSVFSIDTSNGQLTGSGSAISTGTAPTAIAIHPSDQFMYVANSGDNTVSAYTLSNGTATPITGSPYAVGNYPFALAIDLNGNFLYVTNYDDGTVTAFSIDAATGELTAISGSPFGAGAGAVAISIDPTDTYAYVANEKGDSLSAYTLNPTTGALVPLSGSPFSTSSNPESLAVNPGGSEVYVANVTAANELTNYAITPSSGALAVGTPVAAGTFPLSVVVDPGGLFVYAANDTSNDVSVFSVSAATGVLTPVAGSPFVAGAGARSIAIF